MQFEIAFLIHTTLSGNRIKEMIWLVQMNEHIWWKYSCKKKLISMAMFKVKFML
jgi:hypothetical protein